jgi:hypothetical protein
MQPIKLTSAQLDHALGVSTMATHKRHNYDAVNRYCGELADVHRQFHRLKLRWAILQDRRAPILAKANEALTRTDYAQVYGYSRALWDASWNTLDWKLGHVDSKEAKPSRTPASQGGWDYSEGPPTYGGHFHPTGEIATDWLPFNPEAR